MKLSEKEMIEEIAEAAAAKGGRAYFVGGCVRDALLREKSKDTDIEVHGVEAATMESILEEIYEKNGRRGKAAYYKSGVSFGVYGIPGYELDIALPRKESATGRGHRDFEIFVDPHIGPEKAAARRDFTINAMMQDVLSGEILDFFGGREDLERGILRHACDASFAEDPLRVLRGAQFAARFEFEIAPETFEICKKIDLTTLSRERVFEEFSKALLKARRPSVFFETLRAMDQLDYWFPEVKDLIGVEQSPIFHPEGDVWTHTMMVLDAAADVIHSSWLPATENPEIPKDIAAFEKYDSKARDEYFMLSALCHDLGKPATTALVGDRIRALGHEEKGEEMARTFLHRLTDENELIRYVTNMVLLHMRPNMLCGQNSGVKATNRLFDRSIDPAGLIMLARCDRRREPEDIEKIIAYAKEKEASGNIDSEHGEYKETRPEAETPQQREQRFEDFLWLRLLRYRKVADLPEVTGEDLIAAGLHPGPEFRRLLDYAHQLHLAGVDKEAALKQTLSEAKKPLAF